jgi:hypothetical protein
MMQLKIKHRLPINGRCQSTFDFENLVDQMPDASRPRIVIENRYNWLFSAPVIGSTQAAA